MKWWHWLLAALTGMVVLAVVYGPALNGEFVFDDAYLPMTGQEYINAPLRYWIGVRPLLMLSFWANLRLFGLETLSYHLFNLVCHFGAGVLVFLAIRKLLTRAEVEGWMRDALALFGGGLFLLHPVQTESVAYIASRSEVLSGLLFFAAFAVFLYRRKEAIGWLAALAVLILYGAAVTTKEHTATLVVLLLITDYYWNPRFSLQGIRRNWRLYGMLAMAGIVVSRMIFRVLFYADTAGFKMKNLPWHDYFFTQCRVIWTYIRLFVLPYGQTVDYDLAVSRSLFDPAVLIGLVGLVAVAVAAFWWRKRYPLASYGYFVFLILLAPTSSVMPIADPIAERRMYLPLIGLILIAADFLRRWKISRGAMIAALSACVFVMGVLANQRAQVWSGALPLWQDAAEKSPQKQRVQFQLGFAYFSSGRCDLALSHLETAARLAAPDYRLLIDLGLAYDCTGRRQEAIQVLQRAASLGNTAHVQSLIGREYIQLNRRDEALAALANAERLDPSFDATYVYRGVLYANAKQWVEAAGQYRRALSINPSSEPARIGLAEAERYLQGGR